MMKSPFKFLDSYTLEDRKIFFGRDQEITELYRKAFESKILLVYGISGTGKSSLVNCGLASRFDESDWLPVNVRRGNNIVNSLNEAISKQAITSLKNSKTFEEKLQSVYLDHFKPVYLIFDQFEELFIFGTEDERKEFIKLIKEVTESKTQCRIIFIIREEFLAGITEFEYDLPEIFSNRFRVEKMKRANAIHAIEGPCKVHNIETETGFSEELIDKLCPSGNEIELTYLQIYLDRILRLASEDHKASQGESDSGAMDFPPSQGGTEGGLVFTKTLLSLAGSVSDLLGQFLDEQIREFEDPDTGMAILKSFVSVQGTKKQMTELEILYSISTFGKTITESDLVKHVTKFVDLRILRERDEAGHFELRHDALAAKIYEKFTISEKELLEVRLYVENAYQTFNTRKTYLTRDDLDYLSTYEKRLILPTVLNNFVQESKGKLHAQQRALWRLTTIVAFVLLIIAGAGVQYYFNKKSNIDIKGLTSLALMQEKVDPLTSINTAFKVREKDSVSTVILGIILNSFNTLLQEKLASGDTSIPEELIPRKIPVKASILSMRMNRSGSHLFGWTDSREVYTCSINDKIVKSFLVENEIVVVEMSANGRYLAVVYKNNKGGVYNQNGRKLFDFSTTVNNLMNNRLVRFFPSGNYFLATVKDNGALILDSTGTCLFNLKGHTGRVNSLDISPDGRFVATASSDRKVIVWNFNHKSRLFSPYDNHIWRNDTVWSCEFNGTGKYLLTASADSTVRIWKLDGTLSNRIFVYAINSPNGAFTTEALPDFILWYAYNNKRDDARFAADDRAIIVSNYSYDKVIEGVTNQLFHNKVVFYGTNSISSYAGDQYISFSKLHSESSQVALFQLMEISSNRHMFAVVGFKGAEIRILSPDGYQLLKLSGNFPNFSCDGKNLFYLQNKEIRKIPVNLDSIKKIVFKLYIFGHPEKGKDIWQVL